MFPVAAPRLSVNLRRWGRGALACSALGVAVGLVACGGGTRQNFFAPTKIVAFGDENSAISEFSGNLVNGSGAPVTLKGLTYTVQTAARDATPVVCAKKTPPALCDTASGTFGTVVGSPTYYAFNDFSSTKLELDSSATQLQRTTTTLYQCDVASIWVQFVARGYGKGFSGQCSLDAGGAVSYATFGAKTADVINQINTRRGELGKGVLVTVMVGQNDILEQFAAIRANSPTTTESAAIAELEGRADSMAAAIKVIIGTGAKVVVARTPSLNNSPRVASSPVDAALLAKLVAAYNDRLYDRGLGNLSGRDVVGVNTDIFTNTGTRNNSYNYVTPLCNLSSLTRPDGTTPSGLDEQDVRFCNTAGPLNGSISTLMWADTVRFGPLGHSLIGSLAFNRARNQL